ncbi:LysR family transcriptional regulator [Viridibacillus arvi]|uniref:LysR family transcriptional regulator n=1 Tax=Viridibacillus arvi TaxID=263475 RepID=UPI003D2CD012
MEWQHLIYFLSVAKTENFHHSSQELFISQPALSRAIKNLEQELGVNLFDRIGRNIKLNQYGNTFLPYVQKALFEVNTGITEMQRMKNPNYGTISIGFIQTLGMSILPSILKGFRQKYPDIKINLIQENIYGNIEKIINREVDVSLISATEETSTLHWLPILEQEFFLYVPINHTLSNRSDISLSDLKNETFIGFKKHLSMYKTIQKFFLKEGFIPHTSFEGEDIPTIINFVSSGLGIAILPQYTELPSSSVKRLRITSCTIKRQIGLAWLNDEWLSPSARVFLSFIQNNHSSLEN